MNNRRILLSNFIFNFLLKVAEIGIPLFTFPYINRVLLPEQIGNYDYYISYLSVFLVIAQFGIPIYSIKKIAILKSNSYMKSRFVTDIITINLFLTILSISIFIIFQFLFLNINNLRILVILILNIFLIGTDLSWYFQGTESYRYLAVLQITVKLLYFILLVIFVKSHTDFYAYLYLNVLIITLVFFINLLTILTNNQIKFQLRIKDYYFHTMEMIPVFIITIILSLNANLDKIIAGFLLGTNNLAYYTLPNKILSIGVGIITSFGIVLLPRLTSNIHSNNGSNTIIKSTFILFMVISFIIFTNFIFFHETIITVIGGDKYKIFSFYLVYLSPLIIILTLTSLIYYQILLPRNLEKIIIYIQVSNLILTIVISYFLTYKYNYVGTIISQNISNLFVLLLYMLVSKKYFQFVNILPIFTLFLIITPIAYLVNFIFIEKFVILRIILTNCVLITFYGVYLIFEKKKFDRENLDNI